MIDLTITFRAPGGGELSERYRLPGRIDQKSHRVLLEHVWAATHARDRARPPLLHLWRRLEPLPLPGRGIEAGDRVAIDGRTYWATHDGWSRRRAAAPVAATADARKSAAAEDPEAAAARIWETAEELAAVHRSGRWREEHTSFGGYLRAHGCSTSRGYQLLHYHALVGAMAGLLPGTPPWQLLTEAAARDIWPRRRDFLRAAAQAQQEARDERDLLHALHDTAERFRRGPDPLLDGPAAGDPLTPAAAAQEQQHHHR